MGLRRRREEFDRGLGPEPLNRSRRGDLSPPMPTRPGSGAGARRRKGAITSPTPWRCRAETTWLRFALRPRAFLPTKSDVCAREMIGCSTVRRNLTQHLSSAGRRPFRKSRTLFAKNEDSNVGKIDGRRRSGIKRRTRSRA